MSDSDVIADLLPDPTNGAGWASAVQVIVNTLRGFTEDPPDPDRPCLRLGFRWPRRHPQGFLFGCDPECDIVLPRWEGISPRHGCLTFDDDFRPIYQDLGSDGGSQVTYDGDGTGLRRNFTWILGGHAVPNSKTIKLYFAGSSISFQLTLFDHSHSWDQYMDNVAEFQQGLFSGEQLVSSSSSAANTPGNSPIVLQIKVGEGAFAAVYRMWDVSTGIDVALKRPSQRAIRERRVNEHDWRKEAGILRRLSHSNIVAVLDADFSIRGSPRLTLEYVPCGSLSDYHGQLTTRECLDVLTQCLSALDYLHNQPSGPIVHRDIKPDNILVQSRQEGYAMHVKLADFGLTKDSAVLTTICGTPLYIAPEMHEENARRRRDVHRRSYTPAVDLWSTGVVFVDFIYGLPERVRALLPIGLNWCREVARKVQNDTTEIPNILSPIIMSMVEMKPELRETARNLYPSALALYHELDGELEVLVYTEEE